jgi:4-aminobutyrate aminotransferase-like enzyme
MQKDQHIGGSPSPRALAQRRKLLGGNLSVAYENPLHIVRIDAIPVGRRGAQVSGCLQQCAARGTVIRALCKQGRRDGGSEHQHALSDELIHEYAARLGASLPGALKVCYFVNSGSEANELALRLARAHTRRRDVVVLEHAYHGNTTTMIDVSPYKHSGPGGEGAPPWVHVAPLPDLYRGAYRRDDPAASRSYVRSVERLIERAQARGTPIGAYLADSWPSVGGS